MNRLVVAATVAVLAWSCGGSPTIPTSPSAPPSSSAPPVVVTPPHSLSGVVFEVTAAGTRVPLPGVEVEEYAGHTVAKTDERGVYRHALPLGGMTFFGFEHAGFQSSRNGTIVNGDTLFDIQAIRR